MGLRRSLWIPFFGVPQGPLGAVGARLMPTLVRPLYSVMARELDLRPSDDLLDVGCGSARMLAEQALHVRHVAGLDVSEIQVTMAQRRLADRIAAGTAEIVLGDAVALPWDDGRFSVVCSLNCLKFVEDPLRALQEMRRVLRPAGRAVLMVDVPDRPPAHPGAIDAFGQRQWEAGDARRMMEDAGFHDVSVMRASTRVPLQFLRGMQPVPPAVKEVVKTPSLVGTAS